MESVTPVLNVMYLVLSIVLIVITAANTYATTRMKLEVVSLKLYIEQLMGTAKGEAESRDSNTREWAEESFMREKEANTRFKHLTDRIDRCRYCDNKVGA